MQESRSTYVQKVSGIFLLEIVSNFPRDFLASISAILKPYVKHCITSANAECRAHGRKALLVWQQIDPQNSERIFHGVE